MGLSTRYSWLSLDCCALFVILCLRAHCVSSEVHVKFLETPHAFSNLNSAKFAFEVLVVADGDFCITKYTAKCKVDDHIPSDCEGEEFYTGLHDGDHTFEVCTNGTQGVGCAHYNWKIDTVPPTAYVTAVTNFTNAPNVSINISFSEPCTGGGGFRCSSVNSCNLLVSGAGQVIPTTLHILQPNLKFSLIVSLSSNVQHGRVDLVMDRGFCTDKAGNIFTGTANSNFSVQFDRTSVVVDMKTLIPEQTLQLDSETGTVQATNNFNNLKVYLNFSEAILNSSAQVLNALHTTQGSLETISGSTFGNRTFVFQVEHLSSMAVVTVSLNSKLLIGRRGTPVASIEPMTFFYDAERPAVNLSTTQSMRTRENRIQILIVFEKPVFGFSDSNVSITGGHLMSFDEVNGTTGRAYAVVIRPDDDVIISVTVPENVTGDVAGNKNLPSNVLRVEHYSVPVLSSVLSTTVTCAFAVTSLATGLLTVSTSSLQSIGAFSAPYSLTSDPAKNIFRIVQHIQVIALSRWYLGVTSPIGYYEFARGLQWSIPYFSLPWESEGQIQQVPNLHSSKVYDDWVASSSKSLQPEEDQEHLDVARKSLADKDIRSYLHSPKYSGMQLFEKLMAKHMLDPRQYKGWMEFYKSMFGLAVIGVSFILLHASIILIFKLRMKNSENQRIYGALIFPRFEICLMMVALPCICKASTGLVKGGTSSGVIVGILLLGIVFFLLLAKFLFLSMGITLGKLLQYNEEVVLVRQGHQKCQDFIRLTLGYGKEGKWEWRNQPGSVHETTLGPLYEELRGPPISQISGNGDETEDAEATFNQKLFGILRVYYTLLESVRQVCLGIVAGVYPEDSPSSCSSSSSNSNIVLLCITSFQLFFLVVKKPFITRNVLLVEIISVSCEVGIFTTKLAVKCQEKIKNKCQEKIKNDLLLSLSIASLVAQMINYCYGLYRYTKQLDPSRIKSFLTGLKTAIFGFRLLFVPPQHKLIKHHLDSEFRMEQGKTGDTTSSAGHKEKKLQEHTRSGTEDDSSVIEQVTVVSDDPSTS